MTVAVPPASRRAQQMRPVSTRAPHTGVVDAYVTCHGSVAQWGGGRAVARSMQAAIESLGVSTRFIGIAPSAELDNTAAAALDLPLRVPRGLWRLHNWLVPGAIAASLRVLPRPRRGFVAISAAWAAAARRVWPDLPIVIPFCCSLTNCLPFAWPNRRPPTFWARVDWLGVRRTERRGFRAADRIIVPTIQSRDELVALDASLRNKIAVHGFGYEPRPADPAVRQLVRARLGLRCDDVLFLFGGVCDLNKSPHWIARALERVDARAHLVVVGDGPVLAAMPQSARVHKVGAHPNCDDWIAASDVVVSASWYDTLPNILKEAVAAGRPVLAPFSRPPDTFGGFDEIIHASGCGLCYDRCEDGALAGVMDRLTRDAGLRGRLGENALRLAEAQRGWAEAARSAVDAFLPADDESRESGQRGGPLPDGPAPRAAPQ